MAMPVYDAVVVGGGPAGLAAAIYLARARYRVLVVEKEGFGGQITITAEVVNYPGVERTDGKRLTETMRRQAQSFGAEFLLADVEKIELDGDFRSVKTSRGVIRCFAVLFATGAHPRMVGFKREAEFKGHGVAYCATCDGEFFTGKDIFVVGGGFAAAEEAMFLTRYARSVTILVRSDKFTCAQSVVDKVMRTEKLQVRFNTELIEVDGDESLRSAVIRNRVTGETETYTAADGDTFGVFVFVGYAPATELARDFVDLNPQGYIITDRDQKTRTPGFFAAGDVCVKNLRQVVTAVADGANAATNMERYCAEMQQKTGVHPERPVAAAPQPEAPAADASAAASAADEGFLSAGQKTQLRAVFARMQNALVLRVAMDKRPVSVELRGVCEELAELTDKITVEALPPVDDPKLPCVSVFRADGTDTGIAFHGVPGGHEFNSFVIGLYNAAGPGQSIDPEIEQGIAELTKPVDMKILVSLSCTMCPELVMAAQRIAAASPLVRAEAYDLNHFPDLKDKYKIMSVPCLVINDEQVSFGKKSIGQLLPLLEKAQ